MHPYIPVVLDREFSYQELTEDFVEEGINFVIRLNTSKKPAIGDEGKNKMGLYPEPYDSGFTFFPPFPIAQQNRA